MKDKSATVAGLLAAFFALSGAASVVILLAARMMQAERYQQETMEAINGR